MRNSFRTLLLWTVAGAATFLGPDLSTRASPPSELLDLLATCEAASKKPLPDTCSLFGKIKVVERFADVKIKAVEHFPDLKVKMVEHFPDSPGEWKMVEHFPDFTVQYVEHFPDYKIKYVEHFPGCD